MLTTTIRCIVEREMASNLDWKERSIEESWACVEHFKPPKMPKVKWRRTYTGNKLVLWHSNGYELAHTEEEFDALPIPLTKSGAKKYTCRKVIVIKNGVRSKPTCLSKLLRRETKLLSPEERNEVYEQQRLLSMRNNPKGIAAANRSETDAVNKLDKKIGLKRYLKRRHLLEGRVADMAYCLKDDNTRLEVFVSDQVKSCRANKNKNGCTSFHHKHKDMTVGAMISILEKGSSLTFILKDYENNEPEIVYVFHGRRAMRMLRSFDSSKYFNPRLYIQREKACHPLTLACNNPRFRFEVGRSSAECQRLLQRRLEIVKKGVKRTLKFLNEDESQIEAVAHRAEQKCFVMTRQACRKAGARAKRYHKDAYGPTDFRINRTVRIQDKMVNRSNRSMSCYMRSEGKYPYNPDDIDIYQVSDPINNMAYAFPMRRLNRKGKSVSFFSSEILMKSTFSLSKANREKYKMFLYNFKTVKGCQEYVKACEKAAAIPPLTDKTFYSSMFDGVDFVSRTSRLRRQKRADLLAS